MNDINNMSLSIIFCSISLITYIQLNYSSNIKNITMRKSISIVFLILGVMINPGVGMIFSMVFLPLYINNMVKVFLFFI